MHEQILLVDDEPQMRMLLKDILMVAGYRIAGEAGDGTEAIDKYEELQPDLVLMDVLMPKLNGLQAAKLLLETHPQAIIVMLTALQKKEVVVQALKFGVAGFVVKPFISHKLLSAIKKALEGKEEKEE
ncbi:response regulator [Candidatus Auribacterota bacterium]